MSGPHRPPQKNEGARRAHVLRGAMRNLIAVTLVLGAAAAGCGRFGGAPATEQDKTLYALGMIIGRNLQDFNLTSRELDVVKAGMTDVVSKKKPAVDLDVY